MAEFKDIQEEREEGVAYFCRFTFGQFFTLLVLEVITLGFVFYLGAKYGNEYLRISDKEAAPQGVTEVVAGTQDQELQAIARDVVQGGSESTLEQKVKELLERQKAGGAVETAPPTTPTGLPATPLAPPSSPSPSFDSSRTTGLAQDRPAVTEAQPPPEVAVAEPAPAVPPQETGVIRMKSPAAAQYSIQVGSYPNMDEANLKVEDWRAKGYPAFIMIADIPDRGRWYRVRIGGFGTKEDAGMYLERLKGKEGEIEAIIVLNEQ